MANPEQNELKPNGFPLTKKQLDDLRTKWSEPATQAHAVKNAEPLKVGELEQPQTTVKDDLIRDRLIDLLDQRNRQRDKIFNLATRYCWTSLIFVIFIVFIQILCRAAGPDLDFKIFDGNELQIIVSGVFLQFVGLLYVITNSLYDDKNYIDMFKDGTNK